LRQLRGGAGDVPRKLRVRRCPLLKVHTLGNMAIVPNEVKSSATYTHTTPNLASFRHCSH